MAKAAKAGKRGSRKIGGNKDKCAKYAATNRLAKNKARKVAKRMKSLARRKLVKELRAK